MNRLILITSLALAACSSPPVVPKSSVPPPTHAPVRPPVRTNPTNEEATQKWLRGEIERLTGRPPEQLLRGPTSQAEVRTNPTDEVATQQWLQQQGQTVTERYYVQPAYTPVPYGYDLRGEPLFYPAYPYRRYESSFPINTVIGASLGSLIGHHGSHHHHEYAWIGGALGFLSDLNRWRW
jgi:hypothetical protein